MDDFLASSGFATVYACTRYFAMVHVLDILPIHLVVFTSFAAQVVSSSLFTICGCFSLLILGLALRTLPGRRKRGFCQTGFLHPAENRGF